MGRWLLAGWLAATSLLLEHGAAHLAAAVQELTATRHALLVSPTLLRRTWCARQKAPTRPLGLTCRIAARWRPASGPAVDVCALAETPGAAEPARRYELALQCTFLAGGKGWRLPPVRTQLVR